MTGAGKVDSSPPSDPQGAGEKPTARGANKLSYKYKRELDQLPQRIRSLEQEIEALHEQVSAPDFYQGDPEEVQRVLERLSRTEGDLESAMERWVELEEMAG